MSQPNRTARRHGHNSGTTPPGKRDPMTNVYIGIAVAIVAIFVALGLFNWKTNRDLQAQVTAADATPTPGPNAKAKAKSVQIVDGVSIGKPAFAKGDSPDGGNGQPVDGIKCENQEQVTMHVHAHLAIFAKGVQIQVPQYLGFGAQAQCLYWLHTHDESGLVHVEAPDFNAPNGGPYTLGMLFDIWGETLSRTQVARYTGPVTAFVNGTKYEGDLKAIPLAAHQQITLEVGTPIVPPPNYLFPPNE